MLLEVNPFFFVKARNSPLWYIIIPPPAVPKQEPPEAKELPADKEAVPAP